MIRNIFWIFCCTDLESESEVGKTGYGAVWENLGRTPMYLLLSSNDTVPILYGVAGMCTLPSAVALVTMTYDNESCFSRYVCLFVD